MDDERIGADLVNLALGGAVGAVVALYCGLGWWDGLLLAGGLGTASLATAAWRSGGTEGSRA